jgi:hypothetical protein
VKSRTPAGLAVSAPVEDPTTETVAADVVTA